MKKIVSLLICTAILIGLGVATAAAETDLSAYSIANGTVAAVHFEDITAPFSGTLRPFDLETGDRVQAGETLFELLTTNVIAPEDGTVSAVFVEKGDSADAAMATYGSVLALEPALLQRMHCSNSNAWDNELCRHRHVGEMVYFKYAREEGTGRVIATSGSTFEVEVLSGEYDTNRKMDLYLTEKYDYDRRAGAGTIYKRDDVTIAASGRVAEVLVSPGDQVKKGDVLLKLLTADADAGAAPTVAAAGDGIVVQVAVAPGQQVWKGALLARVWRTDELEIVAEVDEMDLGALKVGDQLPVTLDTDESRILTGVVTEISGLGVTRQNAAYYTVHLSIQEKSLLLGQSASVYLPKNKG